MLMSKNVNNDVTMNLPLLLQPNLYCPRGQKKICRQLQPVVVEKWALIKACECSRFSSLLASRDVSPGGKSATQRQKFHTDDVDRCLHNKSGSHGVPNVNLLDFMFPLVGKVL